MRPHLNMSQVCGVLREPWNSHLRGGAGPGARSLVRVGAAGHHSYNTIEFGAFAHLLAISVYSVFSGCAGAAAASGLRN